MTAKRNFIKPLQTWVLLSLFFVPCAVSFAQTDLNEARYIGHVPKKNGGFESEVIFRNYASAGKTIYLIGVADPAGQFPEVAEVLVGSKQLKRMKLEDLFDVDISHFFIVGSRQVTTALKIYSEDDAKAGHTYLPESEYRGRRFTVLSAVDQLRAGEWEGVALLNFLPFVFGPAPDVQVDLELKNNAGELLETKRYEMGSAEKRTVIFSVAFPQIADLERDSYYFEIKGSEDIGVTFLRGNTLSNDVNTAFPLAPLQIEPIRFGSPNYHSPPAFTVENVVIEGNILTLQIQSQEPGRFEFELYTDEIRTGDFNLIPNGLVLRPKLRRKNALPSAGSNSLEKEFDLLPLNQEITGGFSLNLPPLTLVILDSEGNIADRVEWSLRKH